MNSIRKSILGGAFISLGAFAFLITLQKTNNIVISSMMFYLGLSLIMITKQNLFTGQILTKAELPLQEYIKTLSITWIGNFIGSIVTTILLSIILHPDISQMMINKMSLDPIQMLVSSCFCNILVCCAVVNYNGTRNHLMSAFFITIFVILGFEHSIADMTYYTLAMIDGINMNIANRIISLVIISIGNIIGGRLVVEIMKQNRKED